MISTSNASRGKSVYLSSKQECVAPYLFVKSKSPSSQPQSRGTSPSLSLISSELTKLDELDKSVEQVRSLGLRGRSTSELVSQASLTRLQELPGLFNSNSPVAVRDGGELSTEAMAASTNLLYSCKAGQHFNLPIDNCRQWTFRRTGNKECSPVSIDTAKIGYDYNLVCF